MTVRTRTSPFTILPTRQVLTQRAPVTAPAKQACSACALRTQCWRGGDATLVALAVCRMQSGIDTSQSAARLIEVARPFIQKVVHQYFGKRAPEHVLSDLEGCVIEAARQYPIGHHGEPIWWILTGSMSALRLAALRLRSQIVREARQAHESGDLHAVDELASPQEPPVVQEDDDTELQSEAALAIVEDGRTLSVEEYRVLWFVFDRLPGVTLTDFGRRVKIGEPRVSRIYAIAVARVRHALGHTERYFRARGVELPEWARARRAAWAAHRPERRPLTADQRRDVARAVLDRGLSESETAWAFGVAPHVRERAARAARAAQHTHEHGDL